MTEPKSLYSTAPFRIGKWSIHPDSLTIKKAKISRRIGAKMMELLVFFVRHQGKVISYNELLAGVWNDVVVSENTVRKSISNLKTSFMLNDGECVLDIQPVRSKGYMLAEHVPVSRTLHSQERRLYKYAILALALALPVGLAVVLLNTSGDNESGVINDESTFEGTNYSPTLSANGDVVYAKWVKDDIVANLDLYWYKAVTNTHERLTSTTSHETDAVLNNEGNLLAFVRYTERKGEVIVKDLYSMNERKVAEMDEVPFLNTLDWSPDGSSLTYAAIRDGNNFVALYSVDVVDNNTRQLTFPQQDNYGDHHPKYSPDGNEIAFLRFKERPVGNSSVGGLGDVFIFNLQSSSLKRLTNLNGHFSGLDWSADGQSLYYIIKDGYTNYQIDQLYIHSEQVNRIYKTNEVIRNLSSENIIAFEERELRMGLVEGEMDNYDLERHIQINGKNWYPQYNHNGDTYAYISTFSGSPQLWLKTRNKEYQQLTFFEEAEPGHPRWSPDDGQLILSATTKGNDDIYLVNVRNNHVEKITDTSFKERNPIWTNNNTILFSADYNGIDQLWSLNLNDQQPDPQLYYNLSCDVFDIYNNNIIYGERETNSLKKIDIRNGNELVVSSDLLPGGYENWEILNGSLFYIKRDKSTSDRFLCKLNLGTGEETSDLLRFRSNSFQYPGITISPNEKLIMGAYYTYRNIQVRSLKIL